MLIINLNQGIIFTVYMSKFKGGTMLDNILLDVADRIDSENHPIFKCNEQYEEQVEKKNLLEQEWKAFEPSERGKYDNNIKKFMKQKGQLSLSDSVLIPSKNYYLLKNEIKAQISSNEIIKLLPINDLNFEQSVLELLENIENVSLIKELYLTRKRTSGRTRNAGIKSDEASRVKNCMRQGRELYLAGKTGSLMVKPLNYFYSLTAYAYAVILLNNPIRYSLDALPGSHGVNYIPDELKIQIGGDIPHGTFSELFGSFPTLLYRNSDGVVRQDNSTSIVEFYKNKFTIGAGTLLSMIPEIREYYRIVSGKKGRTHPLTFGIAKNDRNIVWEFQIGDGETRPGQTDIENAFKGFEITEKFGKYVIEVPASDSSKLRATVYCDSKGYLWYIENPFFPVIMPEICVNFMLTLMLSNLMRYSPDKWGSILLNEINSDQSLIIRKFLSAFESKFPMMLLRNLSGYFPYII
jgi:hypothetical protein